MTVLNTMRAIGDIKDDFAIAGVFLLFGMVVFFAIAAVCISHKRISAFIISFVLTIVCFVSTIYIVAADSTHEIYQKYECTIDDDYTVNKLLEKYDIVEQRGEIYVLRDKK